MARAVFLKNAKAQCFAYRYDGACGATTNRSCLGCKFFKTEKQLKSEQDRTEKRVSELYGIPYKLFMHEKGFAK